MDEPTLDPPPPAAPTPDADRGAVRDERIEARLQRLAGDDEKVVAWVQGWISRETRLHRACAARTLDFAVGTERSRSLCSTGVFTRRPRRRVYDARFQRIFVAEDPVTRGRRRLRVSARGTRPLWFELDASERARAFADELSARWKAAQP